RAEPRSEPHRRLAARLVTTHAASLEVRGGHFDVGRKLCFEFAVRAAPAHEADDSLPPFPHRAGHSLPPCAGARTRPITAASRSQFDVSSTSCFCPARVME